MIQISEPKPRKFAIIYHRVDSDGIMCQAIARWFVKPKGEIEEIGWHYGDAIPERDWAEYAGVYMLDICIDQLMQIIPHDKLVWIDHHISSIRAHPEYPAENGLLDDRRSACFLCWRYFSAHERGVLTDSCLAYASVPKLVAHIAGYDIHDLSRNHKQDNAVNLGLMHLYRQDKVGTLDEIEGALFYDQDPTSDPFHKQCSHVGFILADYLHGTNKQSLQRLGFNVVYEGFNFCVANAIGNSHFFDSLPETNPATALMLYQINGNGVVTVSMYNRDGWEHQDLSVIAKANGGGGHRGACGFPTNLDFVNKLLAAPRVK